MPDLTNFTGFETGGLEEATASAGSPVVVADPVRTGSYALELNATADEYALISESKSNSYIYGFAFRTGDATPAADRVIMRGESEVASVESEFDIELLTTGVLRVHIYGNATDYDGSTTLEADTWYYIELFYDMGGGSLGNFELFLDDDAEISASSIDTAVQVFMQHVTLHGAPEVFHFDDVYLLDNMSAASQRYGVGTEVLGAFQNTVEDATDGGSTLNQGTWAVTGNTPGVDESAGSQAGLESSEIQIGWTVCDEGDRDGPDLLITGTPMSAKWIYRLRRGSGSGTSHRAAWGKNASVVYSVVTLNAGLGNFFIFSEDTTYMPNTTTDSFSQGIGKSTGGREIYCSETWSCLLHIQPSLSTTLADLNFPDQNYYLGPFGV